MACPFCGEKISLEARICKHCQRPILYSISLTSKLDEKEKHQFFKAWQSLPKTNFKHIPLSNYSQTKSELDTIPLILAWDLNQAEAQHISKSIDLPAFELKFQGGLPSTFERTEAPESRLSGYIFGFLAIALIVGGILLFTRQQEPAKDSHQGVELLPPDSTSESSSYPADAKMLKPSTNLGKDEIQKVLSANVFIRDSQKLGSGFLISADGYILSNAHVTSDMEVPMVILHDGRQFEAKKIQENKNLDVSLIKISATGLDYLKIGDANQLYPGQAVVAIGNPGGLSFTVTRGIVSYLGRNINGVPFIQTDAAINKGNSGGPMVNENMEVVGINSLTSLNDHGISFALPINFVCSAGGVAEHIVSGCSAFQGQADPIVPAAIERSTPNSKSSPQMRELPRTNYQQEADDLKNQLVRQQQEIAAEELRLNTDVADTNKSLESDPLNMSLKERVEAKLKQLQESMNAISKKKTEAKIKYIKQMISLLERQRSDSSYSSLTASIDQQIEELESSRKQLQQSLE
jgi:hypothetical protein